VIFNLKISNIFRLRKWYKKREQQKARKYSNGDSEGIDEVWKELNEYNPEF